MLGVLVYAYFLFIGYVYSCCAFRGKDVYFRAWMGGIFGNILLMAGVVIPSFVFGFSYISHIVLIVLSMLPAAWLVKKEGFETFKRLLAGDVKKPAGKGKADAVKAQNPVMDWRVFVCVVLPISLVIWVLLTNHILVPNADGGTTTGQCTYGDLRLHLSFVTSIAQQGAFPPDYSIMPGHTIGYPFFVDMLSSSLFLFGTPLRWAVLIPSYVISMLLVMGFYIVSYTLTKRTAAAVIATVLFFFGGGFGFAYFLEGAKSNPENFKQIFTAYYHLPTNARAEDFYKNIQWVNPINDMIIPQRTTMAGWCVFQAVIWLLTEAVRTNKRKMYIMLGIISGCMLMIHTHTFLAFGIICAVMFFIYIYLAAKQGNAKDVFINWVIFGGIVAVMIIPQLLLWTLKQAGGDSFMSFHFNWENNTGKMDDPYWWFYLKNWGIPALFAIPAIIAAKKENKRLIAGAALVFVIAELVLFQPLTYDNNKMFFIPYMLLIILTADWLLMMWDKLQGVKGRVYLAVIVIAAGTLSGALSICREYVSGADKDRGKYHMYSADEMKMSEYIRENTPKDAVILTGNDLLSPVYALTGRDIYLGPGNFLSTHGMDDATRNKMNADLSSAYNGSYENLKSFCEENGIDYVYVGEHESNVNQSTMNRLEKVYSIGTETLYKVK